MKFASRSGEMGPEEGLKMAYNLFADMRLQDAAMMFLAYANQEDDIGIVSESEFDIITAHFKEMMAYVTIYKMLIDRQIQPVLSDNCTPAYKPSPWFDEDYTPN